MLDEGRALDRPSPRGEGERGVPAGSLERLSEKTAGAPARSAFDGPARAIQCAQAITAAVQALGIQVRAGLHTGECELADGKVAGIAVSIGARIAATAEPSEVLVSSTVKERVAGAGLTFDDRGMHELKGVPDEWRLYAVTTAA
jgi:class 3 adenylate cyclase